MPTLLDARPPLAEREERQRRHAANGRGLEGLGLKRGGGPPPRITQAERSAVSALVASPPPGRLVRLVTSPAGRVAPARSAGGEDGDTAVWSRDALAAA